MFINPEYTEFSEKHNFILLWITSDFCKDEEKHLCDMLIIFSDKYCLITILNQQTIIRSIRYDD